MAGLQRWLDGAERHRSTLGRVMATRYSRHMYLSDRLLNRAAALEAFDRVETQYVQSNFSTRIRRCAELAGDPFRDLVGDVDWWIDTFRDDRDDVAHHFGRRPRDEFSAQLYLAESAYCLFVLCMMRVSGVPEAAIARVAGHQWLRWIRRGLLATRA